VDKATKLNQTEPNYEQVLQFLKQTGVRPSNGFNQSTLDREIDSSVWFNSVRFSFCCFVHFIDATQNGSSV